MFICCQLEAYEEAEQKGLNPEEAASSLPRAETFFGFCHDKANVTWVRRNHPLIMKLFNEQKRVRKAEEKKEAAEQKASVSCCVLR